MNISVQSVETMKYSKGRENEYIPIAWILLKNISLFFVGEAYQAGNLTLLSHQVTIVSKFHRFLWFVFVILLCIITRFIRYEHWWTTWFTIDWLCIACVLNPQRHICNAYSGRLFTTQVIDLLYLLRYVNVIDEDDMNFQQIVYIIYVIYYKWVSWCHEHYHLFPCLF